MQSYPSRSEKREIQLYSAAEQGLCSLYRIPLYLSEIRRLQKQGFKVEVIEVCEFSKDMYYCTIDWFNPFFNGSPHMVFSYTHNFIETYPKNHVTNFAQELYVIAHKSSNAKR